MNTPGGKRFTVASGKPATRMLAGLWVYALGSIATGIVDLIFGDFESAHQPIQAFGDHIPGREILAYVAALCLVGGGAALLWRKTTRIGAAVLAGIYSIFVIFWFPRLYTAPHALGFNVPVIVGLVVGVAQQLILVAAAMTFFLRLNEADSTSRLGVRRAVRYIFGLSSVAFGLAHLTALPLVAKMIPTWMPFSGEFWSIATGIAFMAAGIAIMAAILDVIAARLLALMLFIFSVLVLGPGAIARPRNQIPWGSNAYNITAVGAVWILADLLAITGRKRTRSREQLRVENGREK